MTRVTVASTSATSHASTSSAPEHTALERSTHARTLGEMLLRSAGREGVALTYKEGGLWIDISYAQLLRSARDVARGLIGLGVTPGDRVAILGIHPPDWTLADCGALCAGAVTDADLPHELAGGMRVRARAFRSRSSCSARTPTQAAKIARVRERCPALEHVVVFDHSGSARDDTRRRCGRIGMQTSPEAGRGPRRHRRPRRHRHARLHVRHDGTAKGVHAHPRESALRDPRLCTAVWASKHSHSLFQFLPLAHVLARVAQMVVARASARASSTGGRRVQNRRRLGEAAPDPLPRGSAGLREDLHGVAAGGRGRPPGSASCSSGRCRSALARDPRCASAANRDLADRLQYRLADRLVLSKVRRAFGPALQMGLVGAAPVAKDLLEFFDACGVLVLEGYGMSETCAAARSTRLRCRASGHRRQAPARQRGRDRAGRRDHDPRSAGLQGLLRDAQSRPIRSCAGRLVAFRRSGVDRRRRVRVDHRPQEGDHHHLEREEHHAR